MERLKEICGESDFTVIKEFLRYRINITTNLERIGLVEEVERLIREMMPCNMVVVSINEIPCEPVEKLYVAGAVGFVEWIDIADGGIKTEIASYEINGAGHRAGAVGHMERIEILDQTM